MNRWYFFFVPVLAVACVGKHQSNAQKVSASPAVKQSINIHADTLFINLKKSRVSWVATEMRGLKKRTGVISFKDGFLLSQHQQIVGGKFRVDMETIDVTDIPAHEKNARKNLLNHLKSNDFFNTTSYPISTLELISVQKTTNNSLKISANLSIREVTKNICFFAQRVDNHFSTNFTFNRLDWKIAYQGSWANQTLVDKDVELTIEIVIDGTK